MPERPSRIERLNAQELARKLAQHGRELSDKPLGDYARKATTEAAGRGRQAGVDSIPREPSRIYASAILDRGTCPPCFSNDGTEYGSVEESLEDFPAGGYINCEGGERCRCTRVFVWGEEADPTALAPGDTAPPAPGEPGGGPFPGQAPTPRGERPRPTPPAPEPEPPRERTVGTSAHDVVNLEKLTKGQREVAEETLDAIDEVMNVDLSTVKGRLPIKNSKATTRYGQFRYRSTGTGGPPRPLDISVVFDAPDSHAADTLVHELGHYLDFAAEGLGTPGRMQSLETAALREGDLAEWWQAIKGSDAAKRLIAAEKSGVLANGNKVARSYLRYVMRSDEFWARSFAQYISVRSSSPRLKAELVDLVAGSQEGYAIAWTDEDFEPIAEALDRLFEKLGWKASP